MSYYCLTKGIDFCFVIAVVDHSLNITNGAANDTDHGLVADMTVVLTTTVTACTETVTHANHYRKVYSLSSWFV